MPSGPFSNALQLNLYANGDSVREAQEEPDFQLMPEVVLV